MQISSVALFALLGASLLVGRISLTGKEDDRFLLDVLLIRGFLIICSAGGLSWLLLRVLDLSIATAVFLFALAATTFSIYFLRKKAATSRVDIRNGSTTPCSLWSTIVQNCGLCLVVGVNLATWNSATRGRSLIPNHDAIYHVTQIANIARFDSVNPTNTYASPFSAPVRGDLYPSGLHLIGATLVRVTHAKPSTIFFTIGVIVGAILLPLSISVLTRKLNPESPLGPVVAAAISAALYLLPVGPLSWGGLPMLTGVVLAVSVVAFAISWSQRPLPFELFFLALALIGLIGVHTSEFFYAWYLLPVFCIAEVARWEKTRLRLIALGVLAAGGGTAIVWPWIEQQLGLRFISPLTEVDPNALHILTAVGQFFSLSAASSQYSIWALLAIAGCLVGLSISPGSSRIAIALVSLGTLYFICSQANFAPYNTLSTVGAPFYRQSTRIAYLVYPFWCVGWGLAYVGLESKLAAWHHRRPTDGRKYFQGVGRAVLVLAAMGLPVLTGPESVRNWMTRVWLDNASVTDVDRLLPESNPGIFQKDALIAASFESGLGYWWTDFEVKTTAAPYLPSDMANKNRELLGRILDYGRDKSVRDLFDRLQVDYVATNENSLGVPPYPNSLDMKLSGLFTSAVAGEQVNVWQLRQIISTVNGPLGPWVADSSGTHTRKVLGSNIQVILENLTAKPAQVEAFFVFSNNPCSTLSNVTSSGGSLTLVNGKWRFDGHFDLAPHGTQAIDLTVTADPCVQAGDTDSTMAWMSPVVVQTRE